MRTLQNHPLKVLVLLSLCGLLMRVAWALSLSDWALPDEFTHFDNGDYALYAIGAEAFAETHSFTNSLFLVRPPLFSLMIWALGNHTLWVLVSNILLGAALIPLTYFLARKFDLSAVLSLCAGTIVMIDPSSVVYSAFLGAEPLANFFLIAGFVTFFHAMKADLSRGRGLVYMALTGILHGLSSLTRPLSYLLWVVLGGWLIVYRRWAAALVFGVMGAVVMLGWTAHNATTFGNATFSTIGIYNLLYYRAASVEHQATGIAVDDVYTELSRRVEQLLGRDVSGVDAGTRHGHYAATAELQAAMTTTALDVFRTYPKEYILMIPVGLYRILLQTNPINGVFSAVDLLWNVGLLGLACVGVIKLVVRRDWQRASFITLICAYYVGSTVIVQTSGIDTRAHTMIVPLMALAVVSLWQNQGKPKKNLDEHQD